MYTVEKISKEEWSEASQLAHYSSFGFLRPEAIERIDFVLVAKYQGKRAGYVQCIEMDSESVYWQLGGAFDNFKNRAVLIPCCLRAISWCLEKYKRITTRIKNDNIRMLHIAMKLGFRIVGSFYFQGSIYLELLIEGSPCL